MTNTQTHTTKREWIATHPTENGWAIGILRPSPKALYEVVRLPAKSKHYFVLASAKTEAEARKIANRVWLKDMGRDEPMICSSPDGWYGAGC